MTLHSDSSFSKLGLLKVGNIFQLQLLSFMYDCYHGLAPSYFSSNFTPVVNMHHYDNCAASRGDLFFKERTHSFMVLYQFSTLEQDWNTLPAPIKDSQSESVFQERIGTYNFVVPGLSKPLF